MDAWPIPLVRLSRLRSGSNMASRSVTTLIDTPEGRCDSRCHYAREWVCRCVCGGRYHGRGIEGTLDQAVEDTPEEQIALWASIAGLDVSELRNLRAMPREARRARLGAAARR